MSVALRVATARRFVTLQRSGRSSCLCSPRHTLWKFKSPRAWAHFFQVELLKTDLNNPIDPNGREIWLISHAGYVLFDCYGISQVKRSTHDNLRTGRSSVPPEWAPSPKRYLVLSPASSYGDEPWRSYPYPCPKQVLQASLCTHLFCKLVLQTVLGMGMGMTRRHQTGRSGRPPRRLLSTFEIPNSDFIHHHHHHPEAVVYRSCCFNSSTFAVS